MLARAWPRTSATSLGKGTRVVVTGRLEQRSWETEQGEKRIVVEIVADEVGPSLRCATAEVHRVERRGPATAAAAAARRVRARGTGRRRRRRPTSYDEFGEEPF